MRRIAVIWHDQVRGTVPVPDNIRPPLSQAELASLPAWLFIKSRSWLFEVRPGDFTFELRSIDGRDDVVAVASNRLGPGDIGCIVGFEPTATDAVCAPDEGMIALADQVAKDLRQDGL